MGGSESDSEVSRSWRQSESESETYSIMSSDAEDSEMPSPCSSAALPADDEFALCASATSPSSATAGLCAFAIHIALHSLRNRCTAIFPLPALNIFCALSWYVWFVAASTRWPQSMRSEVARSMGR